MSDTEFLLRGSNGNIIASVTDVRYARLFASAEGLRSALETVKSDLFLQLESKLGPEKASKYPSIQKAEAALAMAGPEIPQELDRLVAWLQKLVEGDDSEMSSVIINSDGAVFLKVGIQQSQSLSLAKLKDEIQ